MKKYILPWVVALLLGGGMYAVAAEWVGCKYLTAGSGITITCPDTVGRGGATITGTGGSGGITIGDAVSGGTPNLVLFIDGSGNLAQDTNLYYDPADVTGFAYFQAPSGAATSYGVLNLAPADVELDLITPGFIGLLQHVPTTGGLKSTLKVDAGALGSASVISETYNVGGGNPANDIPHVLLDATSSLGVGQLYLWAPLGGEQATLDLMATTGTNAGPSRMEFFATNNFNNVSIASPSTVTGRSGGQSLLLRWPDSPPASSGLAATGVLDGDGQHVNLTFATLANAALANSSVTVNGTSNQINTTSASIALGSSATLSLSSTLVAPGSLGVTTRTGTPDKFATFDSGGVLVAGDTYVNPSTPTATTWSTCPYPLVCYSGTVETINSLTTRKVELWYFPAKVTSNGVSVHYSTAATPGTAKICLYTVDGATKVFDTTVTPAAATVVTGSMSNVDIGPGWYYLAIGCATSCNGTINSTNGSPGTLFTNGVSGKLSATGTVTHSSGVCDSTLGTVTATTSQNYMHARVDN